MRRRSQRSIHRALDKWGRKPSLSITIFLAIREAMHAHKHPDSKRQHTAKLRDLSIYRARQLKRAT